MTDFQKMTKMAEEIGELRAFVKIAHDLIKKANFEEYSYNELQAKVWLDSVETVIEKVENI